MMMQEKKEKEEKEAIKEYVPYFTDEQLEQGIQALVGLIPSSLLIDSMLTLGQTEGAQRHSRPLPGADGQHDNTRDNLRRKRS